MKTYFLCTVLLTARSSISFSEVNTKARKICLVYCNSVLDALKVRNIKCKQISLFALITDVTHQDGQDNSYCTFWSTNRGERTFLWQNARSSFLNPKNKNQTSRKCICHFTSMHNEMKFVAISMLHTNINNIIMYHLMLQF